MPLITQNTSLGSAFGGKIASLNYNYQPNGSPSTATITVVSENNKFIEPQLLSDFVIPRLNAKTKVTQVQYNDDGNTKVLQVELQDRVSFILDKNLILVRGIHSSPSDLINGTYAFYESSGLPNSTRPLQTKVGVTKIGNIAIIGSLRTTLTLDAGEDSKGNIERITGPQRSHYTNGAFSYSDDNVKDSYRKIKDEEYSSEQTWGYSISELLIAVASFGLKVKNSPSNVDINSRFVLSDAGSIRSVLSSALSKFGKSFYVDPIDESIVITDNVFIKSINSKIESIYKGNINDLGATSLSIKKSCTEVTGRHFVVKSTDQENTKPASQGGGGAENSSSSSNTTSMRPRRANASRFKKVFYNKSEKEIIDSREKEFLQRIAYLYGTGLDDYLIQLYLFSLGKKYNPDNWTGQPEKAFYGGKKEDGSTFLDKTKFIQVKKGEKEPKYTWQQDLEDSNPQYFDIKNIFGAFPNTRTVLETKNNVDRLVSDVYAASPPDKVRQFIEDFIFIAKGIFVSTPIQSLRRAEGWNFSNTRGLKIIGPFRSDQKVKTISELAPVQRLFDRVGGNQNITIDNLRLAAEQSKGLGSNVYYYIGITENKELLVPPNFNQSYDIPALLEKNIYLFNYEQQNKQSPQQYLVYTKEAEKIINDIEKVCLAAWNYTFEGDLTDVVLRYFYEPIAEREGEGGGGGGGGGGGEGGVDNDTGPGSQENPSWHSVSHKFSELKLSSRVELDFYEGPIGDAQNVMANADIVSIEQEGPFYEASISYFRPPEFSDLNVSNGFSTLSCSFAGENGVTTTISYSTAKYQNIDKSLITQIGSSSMNLGRSAGPPAFAKNTGRVGRVGGVTQRFN